VGMIEVLKAKTELSDATKCTWTFYLFFQQYNDV
jgi:hypothetical protein